MTDYRSIIESKYNRANWQDLGRFSLFCCPNVAVKINRKLAIFFYLVADITTEGYNWTLAF